jgi:NMD protein affecting ribosome stability and mRNA decay
MMSTQTPHSPTRRDRLLKQPQSDTYRLDHKLREPTLCKICGAVFTGGRWQWLDALPESAEETRCPACQRIHDRVPAGFLTLSGSFFDDHREEIMHLVHNHVERQRLQHPLQRIIDSRALEAGGIEISFTEYHLPKGVGEAVKHAYQGELHITFADAEGQERVSWER